MAEVESLIRDSIQSIVKEEFTELSPPGKKQKLSGVEEKKTRTEERLESRLIGVLSCVICFDLPSGFIYQVDASFLIYLALASKPYKNPHINHLPESKYFLHEKRLIQ